VSTTLAPDPPAVRERFTSAQVLVVGGAVVAPLNLLIVRSLTLYDVLIGLAFVLLLRDGALRMPPRGYLVAGNVFLLAATLSVFRATYPIEALTQCLQYAFVFFVLIPAVLSVVRTRKTAIICIALVCAGTLAAMLHAYLTQSTQGAGRVLVFYSDNPNRLGYPAAYLAPLLIVLWRASRVLRPGLRMASTLLCLGSGYLTVWAIAASASRSSALGMLAALAVLVALRPGIPPGRRLLKVASLSAAVAAVAGLLIATGSLPTTLEERVARSFSAEDQGKLVGDREHLANAAVIAFVDYPYLGAGLDNFRYVTTNYDLDATPQLPHNQWLQLMVQVGAFGTLALAALLLLWFRDMVVAYRIAGSRPDRSLLWALVASMCGVLTIFMFAPEMLDRHYWLFVALGIAAATGVRHDHQQVRKTR
jgi:O-antigen ligase